MSFGKIVFPIERCETPLTDIGANLTHESFASDFDLVLDRAAQANVQHMIVTGSDINNSKQAITIAEQYPQIFSTTAGIHPHHADQFDHTTVEQLTSLLQHEKTVAVGETGLDFFRDAIQLDMPMFLHQREAHDTFLSILKDSRDALGDVVVHCFTDTAEALNDYLKLDCYIGITGWICDERRGAHLLDCVASIPLNRLMIETDAPYLMPRNLRPKPKTRRNEPAALPVILEKIASVRPESTAEIAAATTDNARRFFTLPQ